MSEFQVKDSGERQEFDSGMVRDVTEGKIDWALVADGPLLKRLAVHLTKGAQKYAKRNWMKAAGDAEHERFKESAFRHFMQWYYGDTDEDHAAATMFNINGAEYVKDRLDEEHPIVARYARSMAPSPVAGPDIDWSKVAVTNNSMIPGMVRPDGELVQ